MTGLQVLLMQAFLAVVLDSDGVSATDAVVSSIQSILLPAQRPPSFLNITGLGAAVDEASGTFSLQLATALDRPGTVHYVLHRNYSCISGEPSVADITAGAPPPPEVCGCEDPSYCSTVAAGSFNVSTGALSTLTPVSGPLSPLPFESLRNATDDQLRCFRGGLGQASDTYNIYLTAEGVLPSYSGLAAECANFAQAVQTAAAGGSAACSSSPVPAIACYQPRLRPDEPVAQRSPVAAWTVASAGGGNVQWAPPPLATTRPAKVQLSLEGGDPPQFTTPGPVFPLATATSQSFLMQFALNKPALVIYEVKVPGAFDPEANRFLPDVPIANGRVPVFVANATTSVTITSCDWPEAPGPMQGGAQFTVQYVARDKVRETAL